MPFSKTFCTSCCTKLFTTSRKHGNGDFFNARQTFQEKEKAEPNPEPKLKNEHFNQNSDNVHTVSTLVQL
jgi:hypothetical protein